MHLHAATQIELNGLVFIPWQYSPAAYSSIYNKGTVDVSLPMATHNSPCEAPISLCLSILEFQVVNLRAQTPERRTAAR